MGVVNGSVEWAVKTGVKYFARLWRNNGYLGVPLASPPKHADPIVLVNGFSVYNEVLDGAVRSFRRDGFQVFTPTLPNNAMGSIADTAQYLATYVDHVRAATGAKHVDLVGFSEGGLILREYIKHHGGLPYVDQAVSVATPNQGVLFSSLGHVVDGIDLLKNAIPQGARDMVKGSAFLTKLNAGDPTPGNVRWYSIYPKSFDGIVWPADSPVLQGATNIELTREHWLPGLQGPHHLGLQRSNEGYERLRAVLLQSRS